MGDVLKRYHVIDLLLYVRFFVHRSRKSISSTAFYPTRGNAVAFGLFGDVLKRYHNRDELPCCE